MATKASTDSATNETNPPPSKKRKSGDDLSALSPYRAKTAIVHRHKEDANCSISDKMKQYDVIILDDGILNLIPGKAEELLDKYEIECLSELDSKQLDEVYDGLTQSQVDKYHHLMIIKNSTIEALEKNVKKIEHADNRFNSAPNSESDESDDGCGLLMFNTFSSVLMLQVIMNQLQGAQREVNKALKLIKASLAAKQSTESRDGIAAVAFELAFAATFACDQVDHWRFDTEEPECIGKVAGKIQKLWRDLLYLSDSEIGLVSGSTETRITLIGQIVEIGTKWKAETEWAPKNISIKVKTAKNGQGMGRYFSS